MSGRAEDLRRQYVEAMTGPAYGEKLIVLWRRWRYEVRQAAILARSDVLVADDIGVRRYEVTSG